MYLTPTVNHFSCDIEADGLKKEATQIWCSCLINVVTREEFEFLCSEDFHAFMQDRSDLVLIGHNFLAYDGPMLNKFWQTKIKSGQIIDTFLLSQLYNPNLKGGHSLKAWGERVKYPKGEFADFSQLSTEMIKYCRRDARLTGLVYLRLVERFRSIDFAEEAISLEHKAWNIIQNRQKENGFPFNYPKAMGLYAELRQIENTLKNKIYRLWPPKFECVSMFAKSHKKDGGESSNFTRHKGQYPELRLLEDGGYEAWDYVEFNLGSPLQRIEKLLELGWEPVNKTPSGNPKVDEDELIAFAEFSGKEEVAALATWIVINSRANMVNTWLEAYNHETGCIHGNLFIAGTLRYKHSSPNSANIPAVRSKKADGIDVPQFKLEGMYTYECRDLWFSTDDEEWCLVGLDGKGIQLRCLAHNVAKLVGIERAQPFIDRVLDGDPHTHNIKTLGLANKPAAKKFLYTTLMGGGGAKLAVDQKQFGTILSAKQGNVLKEQLISSVPGFKDLINTLQTELHKTGRITLCDGSRVIVSSDHMVIPYLLQGDESRLMKLSMVLLEEEITKHKHRGLAYKVADIHDEWQYLIHKDVAEEFIAYALPCFEKAGEEFGYLIKIEGDAKIGGTWAETH